MTEAIFPQVRIVPARLLKPETVERVMNRICESVPVRRVVLNGPRLPPTVPEGPARGQPNPHELRRTITIMDKPLELQVQVGFILLELESRDSIPQLRQICDDAFAAFGYQLQEGRFMKTQMTVSDYAKYGIVEDERILGVIDPRSKQCPIILQGTR